MSTSLLGILAHRLNNEVPLSDETKKKVRETIQSDQGKRNELIDDFGVPEAKINECMDLSKEELRVAYENLEFSIEEVKKLLNEKKLPSDYTLARYIIKKFRAGQLNEFQLRGFYNERLIDTNDLRNHGYSQEDLKRILNLKEEPVKIPLWPAGTPLPPKDRVDLFTLGIAGTGKSVFLSGILHYALKTKGVGAFLEAGNNTVGFKYAQLLSRLPGEGRWLARNPEFEDAEIQHMMLKIKSPSDHDIDLNMYEMSGEVFRRLYDGDYSEKINKTILERLKNDHIKAFMLILDYEAHKRSKLADTPPEDHFDLLLNKMEQDEIFKHVCLLGIVITKWDKSPETNDEAAREFILNHYPNLHERCVSIAKKNKTFKYGVFTFSIGEEHSNDTFTYNPEKSKRIYNWLSRNLAIKVNT